jgi:GDSL-like Lipase/Acylhydrolase family
MTTYVAPLGTALVVGGKFLFPNVATALVGDSLTQNATYEATTATWMGGIAGGVFKPVLNIGVASETTSQILSRIDNSYTAGSPGLAGIAAALGLPKLGTVILRCGTNDARALTNWSGISANFATLVTKCLTYAEQVIVCSVPPITAPESNPSGKDASVQNINAGIAAGYGGGAVPGALYIDDGAALRVGGVPGGAGISTYFSDGIHMNAAGVRLMGIRGGDLLATEYTTRSYDYPLQVVTSNTDTYLVTPSSNQWGNNPAGIGSSSFSAGGWSGDLITGFSIDTFFGAGTTSIATADVLDENQVPWQRVTPTGGVGGNWTEIRMANTGRTITAIDPSRCEAVVEVRFNALNLANVKELELIARGNTTNNQYLLPPFWLKLGPEATTLTKTVVMRSALPRQSGATESGINLALLLKWQSTFSGSSIGSIDIRCFTLRG